MNKYIDFNLIRRNPNKYKLTPDNIKKLKILDWDKLKKETWHNKAKKNGNWWCHLEGSNLNGKYDDEDEFWIGFREEDNKVDCTFSCHSGMCKYLFKEFYKADSIENVFDMNVQVNTIRWLNKMIDRGILGICKQ